MEKDASSTGQFVTAPARSRRMLHGGAIVVAAGAGVWLLGYLLIIFGSGTQLVQSGGGTSSLFSGSFTLTGGYALPFAVLGIASIVVGAGYLVYSSGLVWPDLRTGSTVGFQTSRQKAVLVASLFFAYGAVAIAVIPFLSTPQALIAWLIASVLLVVAAGRHFAFLRDLRIESGIKEKLGGRGVRAFSKVGLAGVLAIVGAVLLTTYAKPPGTTAASMVDLIIAFVVLLAVPMLVSIAGLLEFFVLPLLGVVVFGLMIPRAFRLTAVGRPPVVRAVVPAVAPSRPAGRIPQKAVAVPPSVVGVGRAPAENPRVPLPAVVTPSAPGEETWVTKLQTEIANLEKALRQEKDSLSHLDQELQDGRIARERFEEMKRPELDRIAKIEKDLAERRLRLSNRAPNSP